MSAIEDFETVTEPGGTIGNVANPSGPYGNSILATAEALVALRVADSLPYEVAKAYCLAVLKCQITPGLFARTPPGCSFHGDQESQDDYIGLGVIARFYGESIARDILAWGRSHKYVPWPQFSFIQFRYYYATAGQDDHDRNAWLGRFPALVAHLEWAAGEKPCLLRRFAWCASVAFCASSQDGWILSSLLCFSLETMGWMEHLAAAIRQWRFKRSAYGGSLSRVLEAYYGWAHPLSKWAWE